MNNCRAQKSKLVWTESYNEPFLDIYSPSKRRGHYDDGKIYGTLMMNETVPPERRFFIKYLNKETGVWRSTYLHADDGLWLAQVTLMTYA